jgi:alpha-L-rhamnosidase
MWERWDGDQKKSDPSMNSYNHYAYGAVADWIYRYAAGIDTISTDPGFHTISLHPNFNAALGGVDFSYDSPYGRIHSDWKVEGQSAVWHLTIPANAAAELPLREEAAARYTLDGEPLSRSRLVHRSGERDGQLVYRIPAGTYTWKVRLGSQP